MIAQSAHDRYGSCLFIGSFQTKQKTQLAQFPVVVSA